MIAMPRKKIEVVELNKKKEKIVLAEGQSPFVLFWRRHFLLIFLTMLIFSLTIVGVSLYTVIKNMEVNEEPHIKEAQTSIDVSLSDFNVATAGSMTEITAIDAFLKSGEFDKQGEVLLVKTVTHDKYTIKYYSDGMAIKTTKNGVVTKINPLSSGEYGINTDGIVSSNTKTSDITVTKTENYAWGSVTYYSDGSAEISNSKMDMYVRNANDIHDNYISDNKVSYLKESKNVGNVKLNYYYDGTIEVVKNNKSYVVRTTDDLNITGSDVTFKNNNEATIYKSSKMDDGVVIDYYDDGGAIIRDGSKTLSVRKSNSISIKNNKIYEIVDNKYVDAIKEKNNVTYYTNAGAIVDYYGKTLYVPENSDIKYQNNTVSDVGNDAEKLANEVNSDGEKVKYFDKTAVIDTNDYTAIVPKDKVVVDTEGKIIEIDNIGPADEGNITSFTITNNSNEKINYLVAIEKSDKTILNLNYLKFQISNNSNYTGPTKISDVYWQPDSLYKSFNVNGENYILLKSDIMPFANDNIKLMFWTDYDTIPNSEQNKYFYGTIKVYAWTEE